VHRLFLTASVIAASLPMVMAPAHAQDRIYRCGNEYTNNPQVAKQKGCTLMDGGNITIIEGTKPAAKPAAAPAASAPAATPRNGGERVDNAAQPEKQGIESRNYQRYLDRVAELKAAVARAENDVAGIKRELERLGPR